MLVALFVASFAFLAGPPSAKPQGAVVVESCEFGEVMQYAEAGCEAILRNDGSVPVRVTLESARSIADSIESTAIFVKPGASARAPIRFAVESSSGTIRRIFKIETDEPGRPFQYVFARGFVNSVLEEPSPKIDFGSLRHDEPRQWREIRLESADAANFQVTNILEAPDFIEATIAADRKTLRVKVKQSAPWGINSGRILVALNTVTQERASIEIKVNVHGEIVAAENPFPLGVMRNEADRSRDIRLNSVSRGKVRLGQIVLQGFAGETEVLECSPRTLGCKLVRLKIGENPASHPLNGIVRVELPDFSQTLAIAVAGLAIPASDDSVDDLQPGTQQRVSNQKSGGSLPRAATNILKAVLYAPNNASTQPPGRGPLLKWTVANEHAIYGYRILRAESESSPYLRVNAETILAQSPVLNTSSSYMWRDTNAVEGRSYWYYIGLIYRDGRKESLTTPQRVVAK